MFVAPACADNADAAVEADELASGDLLAGSRRSEMTGLLIEGAMLADSRRGENVPEIVVEIVVSEKFKSETGLFNLLLRFASN